MDSFFRETMYWVGLLLDQAMVTSWFRLVRMFPFFVQVELLLNVFVVLGVLTWWIRKNYGRKRVPSSFQPGVSCIVTCYGEGKDVILTIRSLAMQLYNGPIEIIPVVDGSDKNRTTWEAVLSQLDWVKKRPHRFLLPVSKPQRGGRVSSLNTGLHRARYDIIMVFDGDTSLTNDTVRLCAEHFYRPNVVAVSGNLRVRNRRVSMATRMQGLEYNIGIGLGRTGLAEWGVINNISGAFGCFRKDLLLHIGGWDTGTAEDLDLTTRIKGYFGRYPHLRIEFEPHAIGFTDGPTSFGQLLKQRDRWDGDLTYLYLRKYRWSFHPRILGWKNFFLYLLVGLVFQIAIPFLIWIYYIRMFALYPVSYVVAVSVVVYLGYLALSVILWLFYMIFVSRFRAEDVRSLILLPWQPVYSMALRVMMVPFTLKSFFFRSHLDSSMAPYWVLKKGKY
jgi:cellulose synthase/poly-beta-1,6-N-acetylglucosamine synthase-like glycosyltransferase